MKPAQAKADALERTESNDDSSPGSVLDTEDAFANILAAWDEALAEGRAGRATQDNSPRMQQAQAFLQQVESLWPRGQESTSTSPLGALGRLQLERVIGMGGFAVVYLAHDPTLRRTVAVKLPLPEMLFNQTVRERFLREARVVARLRHPHILPIYDIGELVTSCYLVMLYCSSGSLADWLRNRSAPVPTRFAAQLLAQLADAIHFAHEHGVLHRDLKPSNILIDPAPPAPGLEELSGTPRVSDFGLAKSFREDSDPASQEATLTAGAAILGTPLYMAPEQAQGHHDAVGPPTDVHALGVILYELLAGEPPFRAPTQLATLRRVVENEATSVRSLRRDVPRDLAAVCEKCLQKSPARRYASAKLLAEDLARFLEGKPTVARPVPAWERIVKWTRRNPARAKLWSVLVVSAVILSAGLGWHLYQTGNYVDALQDAASRERNNAIEADGLRDIAVKKATEAERLRQLASEEHEKAAQQAYAANVKLAGNYFKEGRLGLVGETLRQQWPAPGTKDRRGFEWYWQWQASRSMRFLRGHEAEVHAVAFRQADGSCVSVSADRTIGTWNVPAGSLQNTDPVTFGTPMFAQFGAGGRRLLVTLPNALEVWDTSPARRVAERKICMENYAPCLSLCGNKVVFRDPASRKILLWDLDKDTLSDIGVPSSERVRTATFAPNGQQLALSFMRGETESVIELWDISKKAAYGRLAGPMGVVHLLSWAGPYLAAADQNRMVKVWDTDRLESVHSIPCADPVSQVRMSPSGKSLAVVESFKSVHTVLSRVTCWDVAGRGASKKTLGPGNYVRGIDFAPDEQTLALGCEDGLIRLWTPSPDEKADSVQVLTGHWPLATWSVGFAPESSLLASAGDAGLIYLWDRKSRTHSATLYGHTALVTCVAFSPDSHWLASGSYDHRVLLWDVAKKKIQTSISANQARVRCLAFSTDGQQLASAGHEKCVRLFDLSGRELACLTGHDGQVRSLAFSSSAPLLASASEDHSVRLWDIDQKQHVHTFTHASQAWSVAFSPDGKQLAVGTKDGSVYLWDVRTRQRRAVLRSHRGGIRSIAFTPDGKTLASASENGSIRLWHVSVMEELIELPSANAEIHQIAFSADGVELCAALQTGSLAFWTAPRSLPTRPSVDLNR